MVLYGFLKGRIHSGRDEWIWPAALGLGLVMLEVHVTREKARPRFGSPNEMAPQARPLSSSELLGSVSHSFADDANAILYVAVEQQPVAVAMAYGEVRVRAAVGYVSWAVLDGVACS